MVLANETSPSAKNTTEMIKLLDLLLLKYQRCKKIYFSWDAASWHASKQLFERVNVANDPIYCLIHLTPEIELIPLPASAQFLNVIESIFSGMAKAIIHNSDYASVAMTMKAIDRYFLERNAFFQKHPKRAGKKIWGKEKIDVTTFSESQNCKDPKY